MSMNLKARNKQGDISLWQTPSRISYTILPSKYSKVKGKKAVEALERYCEWVRYSSNGKWESRASLDNHNEEVKNHLEYIESNMKINNLAVWVA